MKHLILSFMLIAAVMILLGCSEENPMANDPNQTDPESTILAKNVDPTFTGTSVFTGNVLDPGTTTLLPNGKVLVNGQLAEWYDEATDPRVTGKSYWLVNKKLEADNTGNAWGKADIIVDNEECVGKWAISWHGEISAAGVHVDAIGTGMEGDVKGMVAKWVYTMDFNTGRFYTTEGYIY